MGTDLNCTNWHAYPREISRTRGDGPHLLGLVLVLLAACAVPAVSPKPVTNAGRRAEPAVFAVPGEAMEYQVSLRGIVVGRVRVAIGEPGIYEGKRSIIVRSRGITDGVLSMIGKINYELKSTLDLDRGLPIENEEESWVEIAGTKEHEKATEMWSDDESQHDIHSAVGRFRGWRSTLGDTIELAVDIGGANLQLEASHAKREYVPRAKVYAVRYDGVIVSEYAFSAWVSDDPSRVPLKFATSSKWGAIVAELVWYQPPVEDRPSRGD
jgi:hypothetical protein